MVRQNVRALYQQEIIFKPGARRPAHAWFLKITSVRMYACVCVCVCVCVCA